MSKNPKVLLVDDDKFLLGMYQKKFEQAGAEVEIAVGGEDSLSKLRGGYKPEIMVLDIIMPGMDGLELLKTIRKEKLAEEAVVVMLTNESGADKIEAAKSLGVQGYIVKAMKIPTEVVEEVWDIAKINK